MEHPFRIIGLLWAAIDIQLNCESFGPNESNMYLWDPLGLFITHRHSVLINIDKFHCTSKQFHDGTHLSLGVKQFRMKYSSLRVSFFQDGTFVRKSWPCPLLAGHPQQHSHMGTSLQVTSEDHYPLRQ